MFKKSLLLIAGLYSFAGLAATHQTDDFNIEYDDDVPKNVVEQLAQRVSDNRQVVLAYLKQSKEYQGTPIKEKLTVYISKKHRIPYQDWNTVHIPQSRVLKAFSQNVEEKSGMAIVHELTHVYAVSAYRKKLKHNREDRFYDDGLAVLLQHRFGESPEYPDFGTDLYRMVAQKSQEHGGLIPLTDAERTRNAAESGVARQLAYLQEGAFTQYLIENYGLDAYLKIYRGEDISVVTGKSFAQLEKHWTKLITVFM
ncbi:hypothetical protein [Pseudoalteromonas byunsanensis]|uniref:Peptidase MA-like domain-containing protein n=1 Tax=Pseudoalteromonas byunsanensis TaxID=327939 RepID=A0A1S1N236_9GAMM|nr:hypothetical protein [Pseudoalteromonas byunsanensis]OHU93450.1 hypothetical protein BIW53_19010 [Pseudoalteromonas byunsanensis]